MADTFADGGQEKYSGTSAARYSPVSATAAVPAVLISMKQSVVDTKRTATAFALTVVVVPAVPV